VSKRRRPWWNMRRRKTGGESSGTWGAAGGRRLRVGTGGTCLPKWVDCSSHRESHLACAREAPGETLPLEGDRLPTSTTR
jgi:hypothetical protein